jgi:MFS family permease
LSLLAITFPAGPARTRALGVYCAMGGLGSVVGLLLGGALTEYLSWRWVLFINAPIAVLVLIGTGVLVPGDTERGNPRRAGRDHRDPGHRLGDLRPHPRQHQRLERPREPSSRSRPGPCCWPRSA